MHTYKLKSLARVHALGREREREGKRERERRRERERERRRRGDGEEREGEDMGREKRERTWETGSMRSALERSKEKQVQDACLGSLACRREGYSSSQSEDVWR